MNRAGIKTEYRLLRRGLTCLLYAAVFLAVFLFSVAVGSVRIASGDIWNIFLKRLLGAGDISQIPQSTLTIVEMVRLPRVLLAAMVGGALSVSGAVMQGLLKNPLADGSTLGVSAGGALGAVLTIVLGIRFTFFPELGLTISSIAFSFASLIFILSLSYRIDYQLSTNTIILTGVIFSMMAGSITSLLVVLSGDSLKQVVFWSMGSFSGKGWQHVLLMTPFFMAGCLVLTAFSKELNAFSLGEEQALYIGVNTKKVKMIILIMVALLIGASVSVSGTIGFVGLAVPHIARMITGPDHRKLLPFSILTGSVFMMLTDLLSRTLISPGEFPVGVVTSFAGSIIFIIVFYRHSRSIRSPLKD